MDDEIKYDFQKEKRKLRRWILDAASMESNKSGISWLRIKKFVNSKQAGLAEIPEARDILKKLIDTGLIMKIDKNYALNPKKKSGKKKTSKKNEKKKSAEKNAKKMPAKKSPRKIAAKN